MTSAKRDLLKLPEEIPRGLLVKLYPVEKLVISFGVLAATLYWYFGLFPRSPVLLYKNRLTGALFGYLFCLLVCLLLQRLKDIGRQRREGVLKISSWRESFASYCKSYLKFAWILSDLRLLNAILVMFVVFVQLKHLIPFIRSYNFDTELASGELTLFDGELVASYLLNFFGTAWRHVFSEAYLAFYPYLTLLIYTFVSLRDERLRQRFFLSFAVLWFFSLLVVYLVPTMGPCFYLAENFKWFQDTEVFQMQEKLLRNKIFVEQHPFSRRGAYLISGLPSLHLAVPVLGSLFLHRVNLVLACFSWCFVVLTIVTTIYFGWHYFLDDVAAIFLALLVFYLFRRGLS